ncbi:hypothetical protein GCM10009677_54790 [Sphaerisporangium rubeum]|uniref:DUF4386 family protein n=1 Tax=Sphaerisporangium rubeum TaxID=321317 RepID=A0A7X0IAN4_9ACTN|nr:hypothetical protein [Sphaerisporangium rubeum]MBB6470964.1 hypothetical protein [Sphaerisporangium rubeum]
MPSQLTGRLGFSAITGLAAIGFAVTIVSANLILVPGGLPLTGADIGRAEAFFATENGIVAVASALTPAAWLLATLFGAGAVTALRRSERDRGEAWSLIGFTGLALQNATFAAVTATRLAMSSATADDIPAPSGLWPLHDALFTLNGTFLALALIGLSIAGLRAGLIRRWHGATGLASATLLFTSATLTPLIIDHEGPLGLLGLVGWLLWVVWILAYGTTLIRLNRSSSVVETGLSG